MYSMHCMILFLENLNKKECLGAVLSDRRILHSAWNADRQVAPQKAIRTEVQ